MKQWKFLMDVNFGDTKQIILGANTKEEALAIVKQEVLRYEDSFEEIIKESIKNINDYFNRLNDDHYFRSPEEMARKKYYDLSMDDFNNNKELILEQAEKDTLNTYRHYFNTNNYILEEFVVVEGINIYNSIYTGK